MRIIFFFLIEKLVWKEQMNYCAPEIVCSKDRHDSSACPFVHRRTRSPGRKHALYFSLVPIRALTQFFPRRRYRDKQDTAVRHTHARPRPSEH